MPDGQAQVPQAVQGEFDELLAGRIGPGLEEEQQVDVRIGREFSSTVASDGDHRDRRGPQSALPGREIEQTDQQAIDQVAVRCDDRCAPLTRLEALMHNHPAFAEGCLESRQLRSPSLGIHQGTREGAGVDDLSFAEEPDHTSLGADRRRIARSGRTAGLRRVPISLLYRESRPFAA